MQLHDADGMPASCSAEMPLPANTTVNIAINRSVFSEAPKGSGTPETATFSGALLLPPRLLDMQVQ
jgi:hypothetical protein